MSTFTYPKEEERRFWQPDFKIVREKGRPKIVGYAARFNSVSEKLGWFVERIAPGAFKEAIEISDTRALFNHDPNYVLGRKSAGTLRLKEDDNGLFMEILPPDTQFARDLMMSIERKDITQQSFGFTISADEWDESGEVPLRTILKVDRLYDVSPVTFPAYPETTVAVRSFETFKENRTAESSKTQWADSQPVLNNPASAGATITENPIEFWRNLTT